MIELSWTWEKENSNWDWNSKDRRFSRNQNYQIWKIVRQSINRLRRRRENLNLSMKMSTAKQVKSIADLFASTKTDPTLSALFQTNVTPIQYISLTFSPALSNP